MAFGNFDETQKLIESEGKFARVEVKGPLDGAGTLDVTLHVVVVDGNGVVAEGTARRVVDENGHKLDRWTGEASVRDPNPGLTMGHALGYAVAVGTGDGGITTYQWHHVVTLD